MERKPNDTSLVIMDNKLIKASYSLTTNEIRLLLIAMAQMPKSNDLPDSKQRYFVKKEDFVKMGVEPKNVARELRSACILLRERTLKINLQNADLITGWVHNVVVKSEAEINDEKPSLFPSTVGKEESSIPVIRTLHEMFKNKAVACITFHEDIIPFIACLKSQFTKLNLLDMKNFSSYYSYRIYFMLMQFRSTGYVKISLDELREMLELADKYKNGKDLRKYVIDIAIRDISDTTPFIVEYELIKKGRRFTHIEFKFSRKREIVSTESISQDKGSVSVKNLTDKQLGRIAMSKKFVDDYNHLLNPQNPANTNSLMWRDYFIVKLKTTPEQFNERDWQEYLDDDRYIF